MFARLRRTSSLIVALALVGAAGACTDSTGLDEVEPEVESIRLTFSSGSVVTSVVTISSTGAVTGTVSLPAGGSRTVAAEFLNAEGQPDDHVTADEFQLAVTPATGVTFSRTAPFTGTLTAGGTTGSVAVQFGLLHIEENHVDFGPFTVNVSVTGGAN
jgi:hypothetical protein